MPAEDDTDNVEVDFEGILWTVSTLGSGLYTTEIGPTTGATAPRLTFTVELGIKSRTTKVFAPAGAEVITEANTRAANSFTTRVGTLELLFFLPSTPRRKFDGCEPVKVMVTLAVVRVVTAAGPISARSPWVKSEATGPEGPVMNRPTVGTRATTST